MLERFLRLILLVEQSDFRTAIYTFVNVIFHDFLTQILHEQLEGLTPKALLELESFKDIPRAVYLRLTDLNEDQALIIKPDAPTFGDIPVHQLESIIIFEVPIRREVYLATPICTQNEANEVSGYLVSRGIQNLVVNFNADLSVAIIRVESIADLSNSRLQLPSTPTIERQITRDVRVTIMLVSATRIVNQMPNLKPSQLSAPMILLDSFFRLPGLCLNALSVSLQASFPPTIHMLS